MVFIETLRSLCFLCVLYGYSLRQAQGTEPVIELAEITIDNRQKAQGAKMQNLFGEAKAKKAEDEKKSNSPKGKKPKGAVNKMKEPETFESAMEELASIVDKLDSGDIALENSIALFGRAQFLAGWCQEILDKIEGKLKILIPDTGGEFSVEPIDDIGD